MLRRLALALLFLALGVVSATASDFTPTTATTAWGAGSPTRAITLTVSGGPTTAPTSVALSDGGGGGAFYPASPITIGTGVSSTQFVYIPPAGATGSPVVTMTATGAAGAINATHTISQPIATNATVVVRDTFTGTAGTDLASHTPDVGGAWSKNAVSGSTNGIQIGASGNAIMSNTGSFAEYRNASTMAADHDVHATINVTDNSHSELGVVGSVTNTNLDGYWYTEGGVSGSFTQLNAYSNGGGIGGGAVITGGTLISLGSHTVLLAARSINGLTYHLILLDGVMVGTPWADSTLTGTQPGLMGYTTVAQTATNGHQWTSFTARNADWTGTTPTLTLTGPSPASGLVGVASGNFTVAETNLASTTVVTPSDSSAGGTFTPTTLTLTAGSPSGTFTYTPPTGINSASISIANNQSITNPSPVTYTINQLITFPNTNVFLSPNMFRVTGGAAILPKGGAYLKTKATGLTSIALSLDTTGNSGVGSSNMGWYKLVTGNGTADSAATYVQPPDNSTAAYTQALVSGLTSGTYTIRIDCIAGYELSGNGWTGTALQSKINGLILNGAAVLTAPTLRSKRAMFFGDSYLVGYFGGTTYSPAGICDFTLTWPFFVSPAFDCEYGQPAVGSQGWTVSGNSGYPAFPSTFDHYDSTHAKSFTDTLDYAFIAMGINDHGISSATVQSAVTSFLTSARTKFGAGTTIFLVLNIAQIQSTAIKNAVAASGDSKIFVLDPGTEFVPLVFNNGSQVAGPADWASADGAHLSAIHQGIYTGFVAKQAQAALGGTSTPTIHRVILPHRSR